MNIESHPSAMPPIATSKGSPELRKAFAGFAGQSLFSQMMKSMRSSLGKPAYFHGGRTEEIFQGQLDQQMIEKMTASEGDRFFGPLLEAFLRQMPASAPAGTEGRIDTQVTDVAEFDVRA